MDKFTKLRIVRNRKLTESDWTQLPDSTLTESQKLNWQTYRQSLRDWPSAIDPDSFSIDDANDLVNVNWPTPPTD